MPSSETMSLRRANRGERKKGLRRPARFTAFTKLLAGICCAAVLVGTTHAEQADRSKPIHLESDRMRVDDAHKTSVFEGKVVMTQGTLSIRADKITVHQDKDGYQYGTAIGHPATFRQKRDGADGYIEGEADRIEYDGKNERVEFFNHARLLREPADEVRGNYISYDARTEYFTVTGSGATSAGGGTEGRVHAVIQPRDADKAAPKQAPKQR